MCYVMKEHTLLLKASFALQMIHNLSVVPWQRYGPKGDTWGPRASLKDFQHLSDASFEHEEYNSLGRQWEACPQLWVYGPKTTMNAFVQCVVPLCMYLCL